MTRCAIAKGFEAPCPESNDVSPNRLSGSSVMISPSESWCCEYVMRGTKGHDSSVIFCPRTLIVGDGGNAIALFRRSLTVMRRMNQPFCHAGQMGVNRKMKLTMFGWRTEPSSRMQMWCRGSVIEGKPGILKTCSGRNTRPGRRGQALE